MRKDTIQRKNASKGFKAATGDDWMTDRLFQIIANGKQALDGAMMEIGRMMAESFLLMDREELSGPDYAPSEPSLQKWASQGGSVYIGDQKVKVQVPRLRNIATGEVQLQSYTKMKEPGQFSEELLQKMLRGVSERKYEETVAQGAQAFGVSPSSASRHVVEVTAKKLKEFAERDLSSFRPFALYLDTVHRGKEAFIVALGVDLQGNKMALGFWQGATENSDICNGLLADLERRGLQLVKRIIWVTDGGSGVIKSLKERFGKKLIHQRCTIHKDRNIQKHLAKQHRKEAHRLFRTSLEQQSYEDAKQMLLAFEKWLRVRNESAANSLLEALEEILTLHRLQVPALLRRVLHSTNPIESMFSTVRHCEGNIKRYRGSKMMQRWLAAVLLYAEETFRRVKGHESIMDVVGRIEKEQEKETIPAGFEKVA
jgi:putative transposase